MAAPNLSELAQKRFEVVRSPDGRITNYLDKQTGRTLSQNEFNSFMQQQAGLPSGLQAFDYYSPGSIMERLNSSNPILQKFGLGSPGVLPLDQERPDVLGGAVFGGGKGVMSSQQRAASEAQAAAWTRIQTAKTPAEKIAAQQQYAQAWADSQTAKGGQQVPYGFSGAGEQAPVPEFPLATRPTVRGNANPIGPQGTITPSSGAQTPRLPYEPAPGTALAKRPVIHDAIPEPDMPAPTVRGTPNPIGPQGTIVPASGADIPRLQRGPGSDMVLASKLRGNANPIGEQGPLVTPSGSEVLRLTSSVPPFPPPPGRAPMPAIPTPPPAGAPPAAVRSWFGKLSAKQKAGLGLAATGAGFTYAMINRAAETARKRQAQPAAAGAPSASAADQQWLVDPNSIPSGNPANKSASPFKARAEATMRAATGGKVQGAGQGAAQAAAADMTAGQPSGADKVPVTTTGKPDYNYYAEMMNAADRNDAYARDLINLKEQARMAAIAAASRGEKFRFVPVKDYMNNRIIFVNAGGNDVVLDMNDPYQGVEYQKLLDKAGVDSTTMTDWIHRSSKPMLRYMQPAGGARDVTPDFGFTRRSVEMGAGNTLPSAQVASATPTAQQPPESKPVQTAEMPKPTATPPSNRPEPQQTSVAAVDKEYSKDIATRPEQANPYEFERNPRRNMELDWSQSIPEPLMSVADRAAKLGSSPGDVNEIYRRMGTYDYDTEKYKPTSEVLPKTDEFQVAIDKAKAEKELLSNLGKKRRP